MTARQALAEARRRWGENATAVKRKGWQQPLIGPYVLGVIVLGVIELGVFNSVRGWGASWEEAFREADRLEALRIAAQAPKRSKRASRS